jgi:hypothetical protein
VPHFNVFSSKNGNLEPQRTVPGTNNPEVDDEQQQMNIAGGRLNGGPEIYER